MGKKGAADPAPVEEAPPPPEPEEPPEQLDGEFAWADGTEFSGDYVKHKDQVTLHGQGKLVMGPESFEGIFESGMYRQGTFKGADGSVYTGYFDNNLFQGPGEFLWADGRKYSGMWEEGLMHGRGVFENFSFGVDRIFSGFCFRGDFSSGEEGQEKAKAAFMEAYGKIYEVSVSEVMKDLAHKCQPPEPVDAKPKKGVPIEVPPVEIPKEYLALVPPAEEGEEAKVDEAVAAFVEGPFPEGKGIDSAALTKFIGLFVTADDPEQVGSVQVVDSRSSTLFGFSCSRLKKEQLKHEGQAVVLSDPNSAPGGVSAMIFVNSTAGCFSAKKAVWKLVHLELTPEAPPP